MSQGTTKGVPIDTDPTLSANSNQLVASQAAVVSYVTNSISTAVGGIWVNVTGTTQSMAVSTNYIANNASLVTFTLPSTAAVGTVNRICGQGVGGWKLVENPGQTIHFGQIDTQTTTGSISSTNAKDCIELVCTLVNTEWVVVSLIGNMSFV